MFMYIFILDYQMSVSLELTYYEVYVVCNRELYTEVLSMQVTVMLHDADSCMAMIILKCIILKIIMNVQSDVCAK